MLSISTWAEIALWCGATGTIVLGSCIVEFVESPVVAAVLIVLVEERDDINDGLRVLLLLLFGDAVCLQSALPFFWKALCRD